MKSRYLLSAELANRTVGTVIGGVGPWGRRALAFSIVALLLSACAFAIDDGEARAEEQPPKQTTQREIVTEGKGVLDEEVAEPATEETRPETPSAGRPSADSSTPSMIPLPGPEHRAPAPTPRPKPSYRHERATPPAYAQAAPVATRTPMEPRNVAGAAPEPHPESEGTPGDTATPSRTTTTALPTDSPGPTSEPVAFEEGVPADRPPSALPAEESVPAGAAAAAPIGPSRAQAADVRPWEPTPSVPAPVKQAVSLAAPSVLGSALDRAVGTLLGAADHVLGGLKDAASTEEPASGSAGDPSGPSRDAAPQQPSPSTPPVPRESGPLSLSVGGGIGQASAGSAPTLVLVGVVALALILSRPNGVLWRVFCEVPKPSSALLSPLERPG